MFDKLLERFITYAKVDTRSNPHSDTTPTTQSQIDFAYQLFDEMEQLGMQDIKYNDSNGYVTATLPPNVDDPDIPTIGFIAHIDTADFNSVNVQPQVVENYDGGDIQLNEDMVLSPDDFPNLKKYVGQDLVTTDGRTLLGADDKAGIAEIMTAMAYFLKNPDIKHGPVRVAFGPDEEIGIGADKFDVEDFKADFAYTVDGGPLGELQYESFNAAAAKVTFKGRNVHPGTAKGLMINAGKLAIEFHNQLPADETPEKTEGREGFYHLLVIGGNEEHAELHYIVRDHDREKFEDRKQRLVQITQTMNQAFEEDRVHLEMADQYYNMGEVIAKDKRPVDLAQAAMEKLDIEPIIEPIRGGTDGSKISFMGLPTPNLFAGGENMHGPYEYVSVQTMEKATQTIIEIIKLAAEKD